MVVPGQSSQQHIPQPRRQPPLVAHPELLVPRRPYRPEWELDLFDLRRVDNYLATQTWIRKASEVGQVSLGGQRYGLG